MKAGSIWIQQYLGCSSSSKGKLALVLRATFFCFCFGSGAVACSRKPVLFFLVGVVEHCSFMLCAAAAAIGDQIY